MSACRPGFDCHRCYRSAIHRRQPTERPLCARTLSFAGHNADAFPADGDNSTDAGDDFGNAFDCYAATNINPVATEVLDIDADDDDCDATADDNEDKDGDDYNSAGVGGDGCDDTNAAVNPDARTSLALLPTWASLSTLMRTCTPPSTSVWMSWPNDPWMRAPVSRTRTSGSGA